MFVELDKSIDKKFIKNDSGKDEFEYIPFDLLSDVNTVLRYGAKKYKFENWKKEGFQYSRAYNALLRHIFAFWRGEDVDPESGMSHIDHAMCNLLFLKYHIKNKTNTDNRPCREGVSTNENK